MYATRGLVDVVVSRARYGIELVDDLTDGVLVGTSDVRPTVAYPTTQYEAVPSRWVFEGLAEGDVDFEIAAPYYVPRSFAARAVLGDGPPVPPPTTPAPFAEARLSPRTGYPFPALLTRIVGAVSYQPAPSSTERLKAVGARVSVRPRYRAIPPVPPPHLGDWRDAFVTDDGQYTMWFQPDPAVPAGFEKLPFRCKVQAEYQVPGGPLLTGELVSLQDVLQNRTAPMQTLELLFP